MKTRHERGQILVVFAAGLIALCALAALAVDVSSVYSTQQTEKAAADAAALAGAQDLQVPGSRALGDPTTARTHALENLAGRFGVAAPAATDPGCDPTGDMTDCALTGTPYHIAMSTPSKTTGDPRSLQVSVFIPNYQLSFSRLLGQNGWNVGKTSVAVLGYGSKYAVVTLQPPHTKHNQTDANLCFDLRVSGTNTLLNVLSGDIGTNTSATTTLSGEIRLADTYTIDHIDDISTGGCTYTVPNTSWSTDANGLPKGNYIGPLPLIEDPIYPQAVFTGAPTFADQSDPNAVAATGLTACEALPGFPTDSNTLTALTPPAGGTLTCYKPGIYTGKFSLTSNKDIAYLMPGAYRFDGGMKLGGMLAGGMTSGSGVVLVFPQTVTLDPNNTVAFFLNTGSVDCSTDACRAAPAVDFSNTAVVTPDGLTITIEVPREEHCFSGPVPVDVVALNQPTWCKGNTVTLGGGGLLKVGGVIYAPSDNVAVAGNSSTTGYVGQIISWTVTYSGGGTLEQNYPGEPGNGVLRLDTACSGGNTPCDP